MAYGENATLKNPQMANFRSPQFKQVLVLIYVISFHIQNAMHTKYSTKSMFYKIRF